MLKTNYKYLSYYNNMSSYFNSTTRGAVTLNSGESWNLSQPRKEDIKTYGSVVVSVITTQPSAENGLVMRWSMDGDTWHFYEYFTIDNNYLTEGKYIAVLTRDHKARYFNVCFTNGNNPNSILIQSNHKESSQQIDVVSNVTISGFQFNTNGKIPVELDESSVNLNATIGNVSVDGMEYDENGLLVSLGDRDISVNVNGFAFDENGLRVSTNINPDTIDYQFENGGILVQTLSTKARLRSQYFTAIIPDLTSDTTETNAATFFNPLGSGVKIMLHKAIFTKITLTTALSLEGGVSGTSHVDTSPLGDDLFGESIYIKMYGISQDTVTSTENSMYNITNSRLSYRGKGNASINIRPELNDYSRLVNATTLQNFGGIEMTFKHEEYLELEPGTGLLFTSRSSLYNDIFQIVLRYYEEPM